MKLSRRAQTTSPFFAMDFGERAAALQAQGIDVVKLSIGEPDFGPPPAVLSAAHAAIEAGDLRYTPALGLPELRSAIANFTRRPTRWISRRVGSSSQPGRRQRCFWSRLLSSTRVMR